MVAFASEDYVKAAEHCATIVSYAPESFEGWFNLGLAYQKAQNHEKAAEVYSRAIRIQPQEAQLYVNLGISKQELGDRKSTRLNSSHTVISYAVFCLKKKNKKTNAETG